MLIEMWSYYGAKTNIVDYYPKPRHKKIIEPFAGSARYALKYFDRDILLVDKYDVVVRIWKWLQLCSPIDILKLPRPEKGQKLSDFNFDCEEAKLLMGFVIHFAAFSPGQKISPHYHTHRKNGVNFSLQRISKNLFKIKHWNIIHDSYKSIPNEIATWFIDAPYQHGGRSYVESNKNIDFKELSNWSHDRQGQVIVCENNKADWMDFKPMVSQQVRTGKLTEVVWSNHPTEYDHRQLNILF